MRVGEGAAGAMGAQPANLKLRGACISRPAGTSDTQLHASRVQHPGSRRMPQKPRALIAFNNLRMPAAPSTPWFTTRLPMVVAPTAATGQAAAAEDGELKVHTDQSLVSNRQLFALGCARWARLISGGRGAAAQPHRLLWFAQPGIWCWSAPRLWQLWSAPGQAEGGRGVAQH